MKKYILLVIIFLLGLVAIQSYFVIRSENFKKEQQLVEYNKETVRRSQLLQCYQDAQDTYISNWDGLCLRLGWQKDCPLSNSQSTALNSLRRELENNCNTLYR